jgi:membrane-bound serine protease (ClpP class)
MTVLSVALLFLGLALLVAEAHLPTFGVIGTAGLAALVTGLVLALEGAGGSLALALALALPLAAGFAFVGAVAVRRVRDASTRRARCGEEGLIGQVGVVRRRLDPDGAVVVGGALWSAQRSAVENLPVGEGEQVVVDGVNGVTLRVRRAELWEVER